MSSELRRHHPRIALLFTIAAAIGIASCGSGGMPSTNSELNSGQAVMDLGMLVGQLREENAMLQGQIDSLRSAVAYQDTIVRQLAAGAGVSMRSQTFPMQ